MRQGEIMAVTPVTLQGQTVRLVPLATDHAADLLAASPLALFAYMNVRPDAHDVEGYRTYIRRLLATTDMCPFACILEESGQAIGVTTYMDIRPADWGLEIGSTWVAPSHQRTQVNPENKYLLLRHAFEALGAIRVQLKCDARNLQSRRGIEKLGAQREGILRKHIIMRDGYLRDTVMYSIIDDEWPAVKASLEARLGYIP